MQIISFPHFVFLSCSRILIRNLLHNLTMTSYRSTSNFVSNNNILQCYMVPDLSSNNYFMHYLVVFETLIFLDQGGKHEGGGSIAYNKFVSSFKNFVAKWPSSKLRKNWKVLEFGCVQHVQNFKSWKKKNIKETPICFILNALCQYSP